MLLFLLAVASPAPAGEVVFQQSAKLLASDAAALDEFGRDVDIDGDLAVVTAPYDDDLGGSSGSAYIFERRAKGAAGWREVAKLTAPDGGPEEFFGWRAAISGETVLVGSSPGIDTAGAAYIFDRNPETGAWETNAKLTEGEIGDTFGVAVTLDGDTAVVGAFRTEGPGNLSGAAFVYRRDAGGPGAWGRVAKLTAAAGCSDRSTACGQRGDDNFPTSQGLELDGDLLIGGGGSLGNDYAYVFERAREEPEAWRRLARPLPDDFLDGVHFGSSAAIAGETLLLGAPFDDELAINAGAAHIFERDPGGPTPWVEVVKLTAPDGEEDDWFGFTVALAGDLGVVGAPQDTRLEPGYAWVFERDAGGPGEWGAIARLSAADAEIGDEFGNSVAIDGGTIIVGAQDEDTFGVRSGAAYVFERRQAPAQEVPPTGASATSSRAAPPGRAGAVAAAPGDRDEGRASLSPPADAWTAERPGLDWLDHLPRTGSPRLAPGAEERPGEASPPGQEPLCFDFTFSVCDGLELTVSGDAVSGLWRNSDCEGTDVPISGRLQGDRALVRCEASSPGDLCPLGFTWGWIIDLPLDGTMDMLRREGGLWNHWVDEITYVTSEGPCIL